jgi:hypothetical protein
VDWVRLVIPRGSLALSAWVVSHRVIPTAVPAFRSTSSIAPVLPGAALAFGATFSLKNVIPFSIASGEAWSRVTRPYIETTSQT